MRRILRAFTSRLIRVVPAIVLLVTLAIPTAWAHDASAYGGVFRSRNMGAAWLGADTGLFLNAPLAVAVNPRDSNLLLLGTELGLLRSPNGGRSWQQELPGEIVGPVFALAFTADGADALCIGRPGGFRLHDGVWTMVSLPPGVLPARTVLPDGPSGRVFLLGRSGLFESSDGGQSYAVVPSDVPATAQMTGLALVRAPELTLVALIDGALATSADAGRSWQARSLGAETMRIETLAADPAVAGRVWAAGTGRVWRSDDAGAHWQGVGTPAPETNAVARGIAADPMGGVLLLASDRGLYRSDDGGRTWMVKEGVLPAHLESGPLFRDPSDARVLYAVFSLTPYGEVWRAAVQGSPARSKLGVRTIGACLLFMTVLIGAGIWLVRVLSRQRSGSPAGPQRLVTR